MDLLEFVRQQVQIDFEPIRNRIYQQFEAEMKNMNASFYKVASNIGQLSEKYDVRFATFEALRRSVYEIHPKYYKMIIQEDPFVEMVQTLYSKVSEHWIMMNQQFEQLKKALTELNENVSNLKYEEI